jgi:hypothetical protein
MIMLAVAELGRVPLASVIFHKHKLKGIAVVGIVALGYPAVENWAFGFERIVDLRLKPVSAAERELSRADGELAVLLKRREEMKATNSQKREELRRGLEQRDASIAVLTEQLNKEAEVHQKNLDNSRSVPNNPRQMHCAALASGGCALCSGSRSVECRSRGSTGPEKAASVTDRQLNFGRHSRSGKPD